MKEKYAAKACTTSLMLPSRPEQSVVAVSFRLENVGLSSIFQFDVLGLYGG